MHPNASLAEIAKPVVSLAPQSVTAGATATGSQIGLAYVQKVSLLVSTGAGSGSGSITLLQYKGTSSKALALPSYYFLDNSSTQAAQFVKTATSDGINLTTAQRAIIDIDPATVDAAGGYDHVAAKLEVTTGPLLVAATFFAFQRYEGGGNEPTLA